MKIRTKKESFILGMARVLDFSGSIRSYDLKKYTNRKDINSISRDFCAVGKDMRGVVSGVKRERFS